MANFVRLQDNDEEDEETTFELAPQGSNTMLNDTLESNVLSSSDALFNPIRTQAIEPRSLYQRFKKLWPPWLFVLTLTLAAHTVFGAYPVLARLLVTPPFSLSVLDVLWLGAGIDLVVSLPLALYQTGLKFFTTRSMWMFSLVTVARSLTNIYATRFTLAVFVQLCTLATPFILAILQKLVLREPIPPRFYTSVSMAVVGSIFLFSPNLLALDFSESFLIGIGLSLLSALFLAFYMLLMRIASKEKYPASATFATQMASLTIVPFFMTFALEAPLAERLTTWASLDASAWTAFFSIVFFVFFLGNVLNYAIVTTDGAAYNTSFMGFRLVVTVCLAWIILDEPLTTVFQFIGVIIVVVGIAYFSLGAIKRATATQLPMVVPLDLTINDASIGDDSQLSSNQMPLSKNT